MEVAEPKLQPGDPLASIQRCCDCTTSLKDAVKGLPLHQSDLSVISSMIDELGLHLTRSHVIVSGITESNKQQVSFATLFSGRV